MSKKDMILALVDHFSNGNKAQFANKIGVTPQTISTWISRNTFDTEKIFALCEGISAEWLLTGKGSMLKSDLKSDSGCGDSEDKDLTRELIKEIGDLRQRLGEQINENTHLQAEIDELKKKEQNKSTQRHSVYSAPDIATESKERRK